MWIFSFHYLAVFISETDPAQPKAHPARQCEDNQNHAIIFLRGIFSQCIDANQGGYFEQMPGWGEIEWAGFFSRSGGIDRELTLWVLLLDSDDLG